MAPCWISGAGIPLGWRGHHGPQAGASCQCRRLWLSAPNQSASKILAIANTGKFNFDYVLDRGDSPNPMLVMTGRDRPGLFGRMARASVADVPPRDALPTRWWGVYCLHSRKVRIHPQASGTGAAPNLRFSFLEHDFASCFTVTPGQPPHKETVVLRVSNQDPSQNLSLDCTLPRTRFYK